MRQPTDPCLLCKVNSASKTNSHILPKFLSTDLLGAKGEPRKGYLIERPFTTNIKPVQDSPKENYILCDECETYLSILETASATSLKNWKKKVKNGHLRQTRKSPYYSLIYLDSLDPVIMRLLVYSMFWRAHVSSLGLFKNFKLDSAFAESLRNDLIRFKALTNSALKENIKAEKITAYPYGSITADSFKDATKNVLAAYYYRDPAVLLADRFCFFIFNTKKVILETELKAFSNVKPKDNRIAVLTEQAWNAIILQRIYEIKLKNCKDNQGSPADPWLFY